MKNIKINISQHINLVLQELSYPSIEFNLTQPKNSKFGDLSSNIPLLIANRLKINPLSVGELILQRLENNKIPNIDGISIASPGFINFKISNIFFQKQIDIIIGENIKYGKGSIGKGKLANVEFVSANPTGPLTVGHGRNAVIGDTIAKILEWQDFNVTREYYFNDAGRQMRVLGQSVEARYFEILKKDFDFPKDGYQGKYIYNLAKEIFEKKGNNINRGDKIFKEYAEKTIFIKIKKSLMNLGISFDQFTNEKTFYKNGDIDDLLNNLSKKKLIYKKDNATWFKTTALGKDQDRVYIKSSGEPTYRVPDTAYHINKIKRKYDLIIDVFGADHADTYPDVLMALDALGYETNHIKILLYQFVTLIRDGEKVKMSTRQANYVTLDELIQELGSDVVRYFFIMRSINSHLDFDIGVAADQSDKNPVFYLQYAYARICNIMKRAEQLGFISDFKYDYTLINDQDEINMLKHMAQFPEFIDLSYENLEPQYIATYLQQLASFFHKFYGNCKVISENKDLTKSRIKLINAVKIILYNGLNILGIKSPERM